MSTAGLVLAAGAGSRFGRPKAAVEIGGEPLAVRAARALADGGCDPVVVVLGAALLEVPVPGAEVVVHEGWAEGMGSSLRAGLGALEGRGIDRAVVLLCDQPGIGAAAVAALAAAAPGADALAVATYGGRRGHPVVLGADHWQSVGVHAVGDVGARAYLEQQGAAVEEVPCDGLADPRDIDAPADLADG